MRFLVATLLPALAALLPMRRATSQPVDAAAARQDIEAVVLHPFMIGRYSCSEHHEGEYGFLFDALGTDCIVVRDGRAFRTDGRTNADHFIWARPVLAPFDGRVLRVTRNPVTNEPGVQGQSPATSIVFRRADGVHAGYAHVDSVTVTEGDSVNAGQRVAVVSNNGMSSAPHIHVGAWRGNVPLQIRWDLRALGRLRAARER